MSGHTRIFLSIYIVMFTLVAPLASSQTTTLAPQDGMTYYVSSSTGDDSNNGLSENNPFATIGKANSLALQPGDFLFVVYP